MKKTTNKKLGGKKIFIHENRRLAGRSAEKKRKPTRGAVSIEAGENHQRGYCPTPGKKQALALPRGEGGTWGKNGGISTARQKPLERS